MKSKTISVEELMERTGVNHKQALFAREFIVDHNQTFAAQRAGYSKKTATESGHRLMQDARVVEAIRLLEDARAERCDITADDVMRQYKRLGWSDVANLYNADGTLKNVHEIDADTRQAIESVECEERDGGTLRVTKIRLHNRTRAVDSVAKCLGLFADDKAKTAAAEAVVKVYLGWNPDQEVAT